MSTLYETIKKSTLQAEESKHPIIQSTDSEDSYSEGTGTLSLLVGAFDPEYARDLGFESFEYFSPMATLLVERVTMDDTGEPEFLKVAVYRPEEARRLAEALLAFADGYDEAKRLWDSKGAKP